MALRVLTIIFLGTSLLPRARGQQIPEYRVKAAFLYNFAKFVEWPVQAFKTPQDRLVLCVLGQNPFGNALEEVIRGQSIAGRALAFRQVSDAEEASVCQILFISLLEVKHFRSLARNLKPIGILTVGEAQGFATDGGIVNFRLDAGHVRFEMNVSAAEQAQLHISSKLLSLAQIVETGKSR